MTISIDRQFDAVERCQRRIQARSRLLQMHFESGVGHIGGNLSALDILLTAYHDCLTEKDHFVLSKGHAAGALYVTLWSIGALTSDDLKQFHKDGTLLGGHPPAHGIPEILFATGSLGHGLGMAAGVALAQRFQGESGRVICLTSDGEWNEGSMWEALIFSRHQQLNNLVVIIDENGLQGFGSTRDVADLSPLTDKFRAFGLTTLEVDGHCTTDLAEAMSQKSTDGPLMIVARTVKGNGVSFMENRMEWHYLPMTAEQYTVARQEVTSL
jgi:transketolase